VSARRLTLLNTSGETAPPFGIAEVAGALPVPEGGDASDGASVLEIRKPTGTGRVVAIAPRAIEDDRYGKGFTGDCHVRFTGSDPSPGDTLYATSGSWELSASGGGTGVVVAGDVRTIGTLPVDPEDPQPGEDGFKTVRVEIGGGSGSGGSVSVKSGAVVSAIAATGTCGHQLGEVVAREWVDPSDWDQGDYDESDVVVVPTAAAFDDEAAYEAGDLVVESGVLYQADTSLSAGAFDSGDWTQIGTPGDHYCADAAVEAGPWVPAEWTATSDDKTRASNRSTPPLWDGDASYVTGDAVTLPTADAFDDATAYTIGQLVVEAGTLYQAPGSISAGVFDAGDWTEVGEPGDTYRALSSTTGLWNPAAWVAATIPGVPNPVLTTLIYHRSVAPDEDSTVVWINDVVVDADVSGGSASCISIELSGAGGFAVRAVSDTCTSEWSVIPSLLCNGVAITPPEEEPS
jgi:hypothetical protein